MSEIRGQETISVGVTASYNILGEVPAVTIVLPKERKRTAWRTQLREEGETFTDNTGVQIQLCLWPMVATYMD